VTRREFVFDHVRASPRDGEGDALEVSFLALGYSEVTAPYAYPRHQHLTFELIVVDHGDYECRLNGEHLRLRRNHVLVVKPGDWHEDALMPPMGYFGMAVKTRGAAVLPPTAPLRPDTRPAQQVIDAPRAELWPLLKRLQREAEARDAIATRLQETAAAEFFWRLMRLLPPDALDPRFSGAAGEDRFVAQLRQLFAAHERSPLPLPRMAAALGMSRSALTAACRARLALSPARAFRRFKMERAHELLAGTDMSVGEVSDHLGFQNPYHFSRLFRRHHGKPPSRV
jgi:AraC-like DNA-binding protein